MTEATQIAIVDDDPGVLKSTAALLGTYGMSTSVFETVGEFLASLGTHKFDCLVLDVRMPDMNGLQLQKSLLDAGRRIPTVFITAHGDIPVAVEAVRNGAADFLQKPFAPDALVSAIRLGMATGPASAPGASAGKNANARLKKLTAREREIFDLLVRGETNKMIAILLGISVRTVDVHRNAIREKLEAPRLADMIRLDRASSGLD